jgi:NADH-quinone oxidoreductase subunit J
LGQETVITLSVALFYILAVLTGLCAIAVVVTQNIVRAAAWLLFTLAGVAGLLFLLGASFVGATQLLVYVGGTLVLVVFGVMLTAQGPFISMKTGAAEWGVSTVVGVMLYGVLAVALATRPAGVTRAEEKPTDEMTDTTTLGLSLLGFSEATPQAKMTNRPGEPKIRKRVSYLLPFEIVSVHLLVVLIGAAYLARAKRRRGAAAAGQEITP